jgi:hypothetical protein
MQIRTEWSESDLCRVSLAIRTRKGGGGTVKIETTGLKARQFFSLVFLTANFPGKATI